MNRNKEAAGRSHAVHAFTCPRHTAAFTRGHVVCRSWPAAWTQRPAKSIHAMARPGWYTCRICMHVDKALFRAHLLLQISTANCCCKARYMMCEMNTHLIVLHLPSIRVPAGAGAAASKLHCTRAVSADLCAELPNAPQGERKVNTNSRNVLGWMCDVPFALLGLYCCTADGTVHW